MQCYLILLVYISPHHAVFSLFKNGPPPSDFSVGTAALSFALLSEHIVNMDTISAPHSTWDILRRGSVSTGTEFLGLRVNPGLVQGKLGWLATQGRQVDAGWQVGH